MPLSRRSVLQSLGVLTTVTSIGDAAKALAHTPTAPRAPAALQTIGRNSVVVIFEGPWLFSHNVVQNVDTLIATTLSDPHTCEFGAWDDSDVVDPGTLSAPARTIPSGKTCTISGTGLVAPRPIFKQVFDGPFASDAFVYLNAPNMSLIPPDHKYRQVQLPIPDQVYVGGQLLHSAISDGSSTVQNPSNCRPYSATILEFYAGSTPTTLNVTGPDPSTFTVTKHHDLVFRLRHPTDGMTDIQHMQNAFKLLVALLQDKTGASPSISLTVNCADYLPGSNTGGIDVNELGLTGISTPVCPPSGTIHPFNLVSSGPGNCAGGGIVLGP